MNNPDRYSVSINPSPGRGELTVLFAGDEQTASSHQVGPKVLDYHLMHVVLRGKGNFTCRGQTYALSPGGAFFIFPGELCSYMSDPDEPWAYCWIGFKGTLSDQALSRCGISAHHPVVHFPSYLKIYRHFRRIRLELDKRAGSTDLAAGAYLRLVLADIADVYQPGPAEPAAGDPTQEVIRQAVRWLSLQLSKPVTIEQMARTFGYHRTHMSKMFKQQTGMSPQQYLLKIRMERAGTLLYEPLTIEQVAASVGFQDPLHFSKQFKKWYGHSPTEYRKGLIPNDKYVCQ